MDDCLIEHSNRSLEPSKRCIGETRHRIGHSLAIGSALDSVLANDVDPRRCAIEAKYPSPTVLYCDYKGADDIVWIDYLISCKVDASDQVSFKRHGY